ncbi:MAG: flagellar filament capping protein FliD, partial [Planctomycetota bacterium]|nr:flagellar filament capping protein FliD [Planctomycetota bacterium]
PLDTTANVNEFMDAVNAAVSNAFAGQTDVNGDPLLAPKLSQNRYANGFMWTGVDLSRDMRISGDGMDGMNLARDTSAIKNANQNSAGAGSLLMEPDLAPGAAPSPMAPGYYVVKNFDEDTLLSDINVMSGLSLTPGQEINIGFGAGKGGIIIKTDDIIEELKAVSNPTVGDYLGILNNLAANGLSGLNASLGFTGPADMISFDFAVVDGGIGLANIENVEKISVGGDAVTGRHVQNTPIYDAGFGGVTDFAVPGSKSVALGTIVAAGYEEKAVGGVGQIAFSIGSSDRVIHLNTDGITQTSTLNELVAKLNSELDTIAGDPAAAAAYGYSQDEIDALKDLRFTLNENGTGIAVDNGMKKAVTFHDTVDAAGNPDNQYLGQELGLVGADGSSRRVESQTFDNMGTLNRQIISRSTDLRQFLGLETITGGLRLTDSAGFSQNIGIENCKTIGDVIDAINYFAGSGLGMEARINAKGDGIEIVEKWKEGLKPPDDEITGVMKIEDTESSTVAKKLGIAGSGKRDDATGAAVIDGSTSVNIKVMPDDTLESLMYRIAESGDYKCSIINSGTSTNPVYRLSVASATTGEASDFVISCDVEALGFNQTSRGKDAKVLYGDPGSNSSPILLSSSTNSNSTAIMGLTLDLKSTSDEWSSITVDTDKEKVVEEIKNMVTAYNDLVGLIMKLDGYDEETGAKGILFGDTNVRSLMDTVNEFFYQVYNPENLRYGEKTASGEQAIWSWMDAGITLSSRNSNSDGSGSWFTTLELDEDALQNMVAENWDILSRMMAAEQNIADSNRAANARPIAAFNGDLEGSTSADNAINGNTSKSSLNGIRAQDTIANGANTYTITFQQPVSLSRMSIYHESADTALKDFVVEYMDPKTGDWKVLRNNSGNKTDQNHYGFAGETAAAIRIRASSTNAADGKFRLLDVQVFEQSGLASKLNTAVNKLGDTTSGFLASRTEEHGNTVKDIEEQMDRMQSTLDAKEEALWRKFTAMETALSKLQNQGSYFSTMMGSMSSQ